MIPQQRRVPGQFPPVQAGGAFAEQVVADENRDRRNGREDVTGQFGLREGEENNGNESPEHQEFRERVAGTVGLSFCHGGVAKAPFRHRSLDAIDERPHRNHRPWHQRQQDDHEVVPEGLLVLVAIGGKPLQVVFPEELPEEGRILMLHGDEPGQHDGEVKRHAGPPERALHDRPLAPQGGKSDDDDDGQERRDRPFGQRRHAGKEINIEEPELRVGLVPGVPAQQPDRKAAPPSACRSRRRGRTR